MAKILLLLCLLVKKLLSNKISWSCARVVNSRVGVVAGVLLQPNLLELEWSTTPIFGLEFGVEFTPNFAGVVML